MIKVNINTLMSIKPILQELANVRMPAKQSFKILRTLKAVNAEYASIEEIQRNMVTNYGKKDENGEFILDSKNRGYLIADEYQDKVAKELEELMASEVELDCDKININIFDNISLSPSQLLAIEPFIETNEE